MVDSVNARFARQFSDQVHVIAQQSTSRLRPFVTVKPLSADDFAYDSLGTVEAHEITGRNSPTVFSDITHGRRKLKARRFAVTLPIDPKDSISMVVDPTSDYSKAVAKAINRRFDRIVLDAMFADVLTGQDFSTTVTFATDGGLTIDMTAGSTYEKLREAARKFTNNEVGNEMEETFIAGITGDEEEDFFAESELTSGDFSRQYAIDKGKMIMASGFQLVKYGASVNTPMLSVTSGTRNCFAMAAQASPAMCVGVAKDMLVRIDERPDLNYTTQVYAEIIMGAVRTEGVLIQKWQTTSK